MTQEEARALYSDYLEDALDGRTRDALQAFLAETPETAAELFAFERTLSLVHRLPPRAPVLDIWRELAPKVEAYRAERRLNPLRRFQENWTGLMSQLSEGLILWTHALAGRTRARLERYLLHDPSAPQRRKT